MYVIKKRVNMTAGKATITVHSLPMAPRGRVQGTNYPFDLICALCTFIFQDYIPAFENRVEPDQLASDEAN